MRWQAGYSDCLVIRLKRGGGGLGPDIVVLSTAQPEKLIGFLDTRMKEAAHGADGTEA